MTPTRQRIKHRIGDGAVEAPASNWRARLVAEPRRVERGVIRHNSSRRSTGETAEVEPALVARAEPLIRALGHPGPWPFSNAWVHPRRRRESPASRFGCVYLFSSLHFCRFEFC